MPYIKKDLVAYKSLVWFHEMEFQELILLVARTQEEERQRARDRNITIINVRNVSRKKLNRIIEAIVSLTEQVFIECLLFARLFGRHLGYNDKQDISVAIMDENINGFTEIKTQVRTKGQVLKLVNWIPCLLI